MKSKDNFPSAFNTIRLLVFKTSLENQTLVRQRPQLNWSQVIQMRSLRFLHSETSSTSGARSQEEEIDPFTSSEDVIGLIFKNENINYCLTLIKLNFHSNHKEGYHYIHTSGTHIRKMSFHCFGPHLITNIFQ